MGKKNQHKANEINKSDNSLKPQNKLWDFSKFIIPVSISLLALIYTYIRNNDLNEVQELT